MKRRILGILLLVLAAVGICIGAGAYEKPANPEEAEQPAPDETADNRVFPLDDLESNPVMRIALQNGNNGNARSFDSVGDIEWFVSRLKNLTYTKAEEIPASDGWTYRLIIDRMYGDISRIVSASYVYENKNYTYSLVYYLTPESKEIMEEIIALMPR